MANCVDLNCVDPDQTAPTLFTYAILSDTLVYDILGHLPYQKPLRSHDIMLNE